jgi:hypothetical protein
VREQVRDAVCEHGGDDVRVVHLFTLGRDCREQSEQLAGDGRPVFGDAEL